MGDRFIMDMDITVLEFKLRVKDNISLPEHPGSTFRGAFGHGLYNICCSLRNKICDKCNLKSNCAYSLLFNPFLTGKEREDSSTRFHNKPRPFIIINSISKELYKKGEVIEFQIVLFGYMSKFIPFIIESWRYLQKEGLGANRGEFQLEEVWQTNEIKGNSVRIYSIQDNKINNHDIKINSQDIKNYSSSLKDKNNITLSLETPILLKYQNKYVKELDFSVLIQNLFRRLSSLSYFYGKEKLELNFQEFIDKAKTIKIENNQTEWIHWQRLSNRQDRKIEMYGLTREITYMGELNTYLEYLIWGQYTNVGKNTAFGQGVYRVLS